MSQSGVERVIDDSPLFDRGLIIWTDQPESLTDEVQPRGGWFDVYGLDCIRFVDDPGDAVQDRIGQLVVLDDRMK